ncbi:MAG: hypothetical protein HAW67_02615 [Endozoicomonadaceae bacterium]|nr:hypothetical protein [Endozoicomonadaceae bacterium]
MQGEIVNGKTYTTPSSHVAYEVMGIMRQLSGLLSAANKKINELDLVKQTIPLADNQVLHSIDADALQKIIIDTFDLSLIINTVLIGDNGSPTAVAATVYVLTTEDGYQPVSTVEHSLKFTEGTKAIEVCESEAITLVAAQVGIYPTQAISNTSQRIGKCEKKAKELDASTLLDEEELIESLGHMHPQYTPSTESSLEPAPLPKQKKQTSPQKRKIEPKVEVSVNDHQQPTSEGVTLNQMKVALNHYVTETRITQKIFIQKTLGQGHQGRAFRSLSDDDIKKLYQTIKDKGEIK